MNGFRNLRGYALALTAAVLWATLGLFYTRLAQAGLSLFTIVFLRAALGALLLLLFISITRQRVRLCLERRDWLL